MRLEAYLPDSWWEFAFATATHVYNCTPIKRLKWKMPQEIFTGKKPRISHLRVFGCGAYVYLPSEVCANKLTPRSELMIFIGYEDKMAIDLFAIHKGMLYSALPKLSLIKDTSLDVHLLTPESKYLLVD